MTNLDGLMQDDYQLTLQHLLGRMRSFPDAGEVVTLADGTRTRARHGEIVARIDRLTHALAQLGDRAAEIGSARSPGTPSATLSATSRFPAVGAVLHTINPAPLPRADRVT